ncbi:MAG: PNPOx family protein [Microthrixaceae bacterium]
MPQRHWTAAIYTRANPAMRWVLRSRFHRLFSGRTVLLGVTGRRTGRQYDICVGYSLHDPTTIDVLVSDASNRTWWRNFIDGGQVDVTFRGQELTGWATAYRPSDGEFTTVADRSLPRILGSSGAKRFFGLSDFDPLVGLRPEDLDLLEQFAVAVTITFSGPAAR